MHVMFLEFKCCVILLLSSSLPITVSLDSPIIKLLPLSGIMIVSCPLLAINQPRAIKNDSVARLSATSRYNTLIVKRTKITPYRYLVLEFFLAYFVALIFIGPK